MENICKNGKNKIILMTIAYEIVYENYKLKVNSKMNNYMLKW